MWFNFFLLGKKTFSLEKSARYVIKIMIDQVKKWSYNLVFVGKPIFMMNNEFYSRIRHDGWRIGGGGQTEPNAVEKLQEGRYFDFLDALDVFDDDLSIVGHDDRRVLPWEAPNPVGQYTLTSLPRPRHNESSVSYMRELGERLEVTTDIVVSCMDKDVAQGVYREVSNHAGRSSKIFSLFIGGGPVQNSERQDALNRAIFFLYKVREQGGLPNLQRLWAIAHNHQCGAVKHFLGNIPLHEYLTDLLGEKVEKQGQMESGVMGALARNGVDELKRLAYMSPNKPLFVGIADTFRDGRGGVRLIPTPDGMPLSVENLDSDHYVRQAAKFIKFS